MSFLLRAALVICTLSYFALQQRGGRAVPTPAGVTDALTSAIAASAAAVPPEARERVAKAALGELVRRAGQSVPPVPDPASHDTLSPADRSPEWRGIAP